MFLYGSPQLKLHFLPWVAQMVKNLPTMQETQVRLSEAAEGFVLEGASGLARFVFLLACRWYCLFSFLFFFFFCTGVGGEGCFSCHWWKSNSQCLMAGCYFTLCRFLFQQKLSLLLFFLLVVFASSEVERRPHLVKGSACFASIQIHMPGYPASDVLNRNTSMQAGK